MNQQTLEAKNSSAATSLLSNGAPTKERMAGNTFIVWINPNVDEATEDFQNNLVQLEDTVSHIRTFSLRDEAIDFLTDHVAMTAFLIVYDNLAQVILPLIHDIPHLHAIYILISGPYQIYQWINEWKKIQGVYKDLPAISDSLKPITQQCEQDSIAMSFIDTNDKDSTINLNQLEPSFMYSQLMKEVLLEMEDDTNSIPIFVEYCRRMYKDNTCQLDIINKFENTYEAKQAIWWYTRQCFLFQMLNQALRELQGTTIINMGFFIRHLHHQIQQLHTEQMSTYERQPFIVYRGQGLSKVVFEKHLTTRGALMCFNNFLSTTKEKRISLKFAKNASSKPNFIGILFRIVVDPTTPSTAFAAIREHSFFEKEDEVLFSMNTVFRVGNVAVSDYDNTIYQVDLTLTDDDDEQLHTLTDCIRTETFTANRWDILARLLVQISQPQKAEELYLKLLEKISEPVQTAICYTQLATIKGHQGDHKTATQYAAKSLEICQQTLPADHLLFATYYDIMAGLYHDIGDYPKALSFYEKDIEFCQNNLPVNHPWLATCYISIAGVYLEMGEHSKALSFYEKSLEICQKSLPANHPSLATCYGDMGVLYRDMGEYSKALSLYEKGLEICQQTLLANHPSLATYFGNMAVVYREMGDYSKALAFHEKDLEIREKILPVNHPSLATCYGNMAGVYYHMGDYPKALSFYEKDLEICQKALPANHPSLAACFGNMGLVYHQMGEYSKALSLYEKNLEIKEKTLPANHPSLATCYGNMAGVYREMGDYSKALSFHEKDLEICQKTLPANHPSLSTCFGNIAGVYRDMGEYSRALSFYGKDLEIKEKTLPANHPSLATCFGNMAGVYRKMGEYSKALSFYEKDLKICQKALPANHPQLGTSYNNIAAFYMHTMNYSEALSYWERALKIFQISLPATHPYLERVRSSLELVKRCISN